MSEYIDVLRGMHHITCVREMETADRTVAVIAISPI